MRRALEVKNCCSWTAEVVGTVTLLFEERHRRRVLMTDDEGEPFLLDLANAVLLNDGDGLVLESGIVILVRAAPEKVADLDCGNALDNTRLAWHIGNRHTPVQVLDDGALRIVWDHVLVGMAEGLGAKVVKQSLPFQPEGGAYASRGHGHDH